MPIFFQPDPCLKLSLPSVITPETHATHAALVFDSLQPKGLHLNLRSGPSRNRASHDSGTFEMQRTVLPTVTSGVILPFEHLTVVRLTRSETRSSSMRVH